MRLASRIARLPPYLFVDINRRIAEKRARDEKVISFAIGDPDIPTPQDIVDRLCRAARVPANHRYPETDGLPELRKAIASWYQRRFGVSLDPAKEVLPLIGSKEGIANISMCLIDPGDVALVPDPGYPVYSIGAMFAGGTAHYMPLLERNNFLPDLEAVPESVARKAKVLWINYPNNPTGAVADSGFFDKVVAFATKYQIPVCHDGPYSDVAYDGYRPVSFLEAKGAREIGIEFHSCSKTYNMTGFRIGMAVGNPELINALMRYKSNIDSGIFQAVQEAAIQALTGSQGVVGEHNAIYQRRRDALVSALRDLGLRVSPPRASLYLWVQVPEGHTSVSFTAKLLDETAIAVTPGNGYGPSGEGYIRLSLTTPDADLFEGVERLKAWKARIGSLVLNKAGG
ncbi:MAG: LL-diaminopimelate aminotransferase [Chloroflexi bacterium]|nr:LL-diaminopimelate aminotransferase [Chloroflexota bacterium]